MTRGINSTMGWVLLALLVGSGSGFSVELCGKRISSRGPKACCELRMSSASAPTAGGVTEGDGEVLEEEEEKIRFTEPGPPRPNYCPDCEICGGTGRVAGGLGAIFDWMPIKAYRPCPNLIKKGGNYQRVGQGLDDLTKGGSSGL
mmetsp:Transcript_33138/g.76369  ORF Transcript_33138/g.76369 Transcript_33138/m.76369 type:complete len:145 (-) Transcript_33138:2134-2568(-)